MIFRQLAIDTTELRREILYRSLITPSSHGHQRDGGWRSTPDLLAWNFPFEQGILGVIRRGILEGIGVDCYNNEVNIPAWAVVHKDGSYHDWHVHGGAGWSGVFYVDAGRTSVHHSGETLFETGSGVEVVKPEPGKLVLFRSNIRHRTQPHNSPEPRISIAFNIDPR